MQQIETICFHIAPLQYHQAAKPEKPTTQLYLRFKETMYWKRRNAISKIRNGCSASSHYICGGLLNCPNHCLWVVWCVGGVRGGESMVEAVGSRTKKEDNLCWVYERPHRLGPTCVFHPGFFSWTTQESCVVLFKKKKNSPNLLERTQETRVCRIVLLSQRDQAAGCGSPLLTRQ